MELVNKNNTLLSKFPQFEFFKETPNLRSKGNFPFIPSSPLIQTRHPLRLKKRITLDTSPNRTNTEVIDHLVLPIEDKKFPSTNNYLYKKFNNKQKLPKNKNNKERSISLNLNCFTNPNDSHKFFIRRIDNDMKTILSKHKKKENKNSIEEKKNTKYKDTFEPLRLNKTEYIKEFKDFINIIKNDNTNNIVSKIKNKNLAKVNNIFFDDLVNNINKKITLVTQKNESISDEIIMNLLDSEILQLSRRIQKEIYIYGGVSNFSKYSPMNKNSEYQPFINNIIKDSLLDKFMQFADTNFNIERRGMKLKSKLEDLRKESTINREKVVHFIVGDIERPHIFSPVHKKDKDKENNKEKDKDKDKDKEKEIHSKTYYSNIEVSSNYLGTTITSKMSSAMVNTLFSKGGEHFFRHRGFVDYMFRNEIYQRKQIKSQSQRNHKKLINFNFDKDYNNNNNNDNDNNSISKLIEEKEKKLSKSFDLIYSDKIQKQLEIESEIPQKKKTDSARAKEEMNELNELLQLGKNKMNLIYNTKTSIFSLHNNFKKHMKMERLIKEEKKKHEDNNHHNHHNNHNNHNNHHNNHNDEIPSPIKKVSSPEEMPINLKNEKKNKKIIKPKNHNLINNNINPHKEQTKKNENKKKLLKHQNQHEDKSQHSDSEYNKKEKHNISEDDDENSNISIITPNNNNNIRNNKIRNTNRKRGSISKKETNFFQSGNVLNVNKTTTKKKPRNSILKKNSNIEKDKEKDKDKEIEDEDYDEEVLTSAQQDVIESLLSLSSNALNSQKQMDTLLKDQTFLSKIDQIRTEILRSKKRLDFFGSKKDITNQEIINYLLSQFGIGTYENGIISIDSSSIQDQITAGKKAREDFEKKHNLIKDKKLREVEYQNKGLYYDRMSNMWRFKRKKREEKEDEKEIKLASKNAKLAEFNIQQNLKYELSLTNTESGKEKFNDFLKHLQELKKDNVENYLNLLEENYETYEEQIKELSEARQMEERINKFISSFNTEQNKNVALREHMESKCKAEDRKVITSLGYYNRNNNSKKNIK